YNAARIPNNDNNGDTRIAMDFTRTPMPWPQRLVRLLDGITLFIGRSIAWLTVMMVLVTCVVVILRRGFDIGSIALQESVTYMHAAVFLLGTAYALQYGAHVRVDILYRRFTPRTRAWINSLGALLLLLPVSIFIGFINIEFVSSAWRIREGSADSGGLRLVYWLKTLIPLMAVNLSLQAVAEILRNTLVLMNITDAANEAADSEAAQ